MLSYKCPRCSFDLDKASESCPRCGIDFASWRTSKKGGFVLGLGLCAAVVAAAAIWTSYRSGPTPAAVTPPIAAPAPTRIPAAEPVPASPTALPTASIPSNVAAPDPPVAAPPPAPQVAVTEETPTPTPTPIPQPVPYVESTDSPGVDSAGTVVINGVLANRGDGAGCQVRIALRVHYKAGGVAASGETTVARIEPHAKAEFTDSVKAPRDLGASAKQANATDMWYEKEMRPMGGVDASVVSFEPCRE